MLQRSYKFLSTFDIYQNKLLGSGEFMEGSGIVRIIKALLTQKYIIKQHNNQNVQRPISAFYDL